MSVWTLEYLESLDVLGTALVDTPLQHCSGEGQWFWTGRPERWSVCLRKETGW